MLDRDLVLPMEGGAKMGILSCTTTSHSKDNRRSVKVSHRSKARPLGATSAEISSNAPQGTIDV